MGDKHFDELSARLRNQAEAAPPARDASRHLLTLNAQVEAIARGDMAAVLEHATDDVTLAVFAPPEFQFVRTASGAAAFRRAIEQNFAAVVEQRPQVRDLYTDGDTVVLFGRETGILRSTGAHYDVEFVERFTFRDGRLSAVQIIAAHTKPLGD